MFFEIGFSLLERDQFVLVASPYKGTTGVSLRKYKKIIGYGGMVQWSFSGSEPLSFFSLWLKRFQLLDQDSNLVWQKVGEYLLWSVE